MFDSLHATLRKEGSLHLFVRIVPGASKTELVQQLEDGSYKIRVAAQPDGGKANAELISFIAKELGVAKSQVEIVSGQTSRRKVVLVSG